MAAAGDAYFIGRHDMQAIRFRWFRCECGRFHTTGENRPPVECADCKQSDDGFDSAIPMGVVSCRPGHPQDLLSRVHKAYRAWQAQHERAESAHRDGGEASPLTDAIPTASVGGKPVPGVKSVKVTMAGEMEAELRRREASERATPLDPTAAVNSARLLESCGLDLEGI